MWRTILLGKLAVSILASLAVGVICLMQPGRNKEEGLIESGQWIGLGIFFLVLGLLQIVAIYLMMRKKA